ncbi:MAG: aarF domain-containing kinase, partial [Myxococcota bacterium]
TGVIDDFTQTIQEELDFREEARNMDEFNEILAKHGEDSRICAPHVYWERTSERLLTMERFYGFKADDIEEAKRRNHDSERWLRVGLRGWNLTMMLHGFFHGDVHAGNLMFLPDRDKIGYIDFGIVGRFTPEQRMQVLRYVLSFATSDFEELARVLVEMNAADADIDIPTVAKDLERVYAPMLSVSMSEIDYGRMLPDIIANSRQHGLRMPREFILILKQLLYFDRYAKLSAPDLNVFSDVYLFDFLFTPAAAESGLDLTKIGVLLMAVQKKMSQELTAPVGPIDSAIGASKNGESGAPRQKKKVKVRVKPKT